MTNELKRQTTILDRIRINTQKTEENTRETGDKEEHGVVQ